MPSESFAKIIPDASEDPELRTTWVPTDDEQSRVRRISNRVNRMLEERYPHERLMRESVHLYHGQSRANEGDDSLGWQAVAPYGYIFVEAKTAEEIQATRDYTFIAREDAGDSWKVDILKDVKKHADNKQNMQSLKHRRTRMKNVYGVAIERKGYRLTMRRIKERKLGERDGEMVEWQERIVPVYDDLYTELVNPLDFAVDPSATTMNNAEDCVHFHSENWSVFQESYRNDPKFKNTDHVHPGTDNKVLITEYFNKLTDEWVVMAQGDGNGDQTGVGRYVEILNSPLPDDHKEIPFVSYHNNPGYITNVIDDTQYSSPSDGGDVSGISQSRMGETFWTRGDPITMKDLIDLNTGFHRAMFRSAKRAGESIIATDKGFKFDDRRNWKGGDQAVGARGRFEVVSLGANNVGNFDYVFNTIFEMMVQVTGTDPRSLSDSGTKTATEAAIQRETAMKRLQAGVEFNEVNGGIRAGRLDMTNYQQYYSIPEMVRITGDEDIEQFHDVEKDPASGRAVIGKRFRRIASERKIKEYKKSGKYYLTESEEGTNSFLSRPDYIRSSQIDVVVESSRDVSQIRAIEVAQAQEALGLVASLLPLTQPAVGPDGAPQEPLIDKNDLPNVGALTRKLTTALGLSSDRDIGNEGEEEDGVKGIDYKPLEIEPTQDQLAAISPQI